MAPHKMKSRTFARVNKRTISGTKTVYNRRKPKLGTCSVTGETLKGVPRVLPVKLRKMAISKKRPSRPFGGVLSSRASRTELKARARKLQL
jgi:large subunit ribosomal protein L34e